MNNQAIIIGGSSKIGLAFADKLRANRHNYYVTTRNSIIADNEIYFDLLSKNYKDMLANAKNVAILCGGITSIEECQRNPKSSREVNVFSIVSLVKELIKNNVFVIYLSSSTVFDGELAWPNENSHLTPVIEYGKQKAESEKLLLAIPNSEKFLAIVRITKILTNSTNSIENYLFLELRNRKLVNPFEDLLMAPVSEYYAIENLYKIFRKKIPGVYHLSGETEISYADLCYEIAKKFDFDRNIIKPIKINNSGANILFQPKHPGLGMESTGRLLNIKPEKTIEMLNIFNKKENEY